MKPAFDYITEVDRSIAVLQAGGVILYPTDTIWGLGCDATNEEAVREVFSIKKRPAQKSCIILFPTLREVLKYTAYPPDGIYDIMDQYKSVPTTFIIDHAIGLAAGAVNEDQSMAFRIPRHRFCIQLLKKFGRPLVSTSANVSGEPSPAGFSDISETVRRQAGYVVDPGIPDSSTHSPSRIIRIYADGRAEVIR